MLCVYLNVFPIHETILVVTPRVSFCGSISLAFAPCRNSSSLLEKTSSNSEIAELQINSLLLTHVLIQHSS